MARNFLCDYCGRSLEIGEPRAVLFDFFDNGRDACMACLHARDAARAEAYLNLAREVEPVEPPLGYWDYTHVHGATSNRDRSLTRYNITPSFEDKMQ